MRINVHIYQSPIKHESRIEKITQTLIQNNFFDKIYIVGILEPGLKESEFLNDKIEIVRIPRKTLSSKSGVVTKIIATWMWTRRIRKYFRNLPVDCVNCHSLPVLPLCAGLAKSKKAKLIYDTHELETETLVQHGIRKYLSKITERRFIRRADHVFVVCESISRWYRDKYGISKPDVIRNMPVYKEIRGMNQNLFRKEFGIKEESIVFLTQGILDEGRGIERILNVFEKVHQDRHIVFLGYGELESLIREKASLYPNIHFKNAVPSKQIQEYTSGADVGLCLIENKCLSYYYSLPNKLLEFIMAGLGVIINDLPEQKSLVDMYLCGMTAPENDDEFVNCINSLSKDQIGLWKQNSANAASQMGWHLEELKLTEVYKKILG